MAQPVLARGEALQRGKAGHGVKRQHHGREQDSNMEPDWNSLEAWLHRTFDGMARRNGTPMVGHSIRVGRLVQQAGGDRIAVFGGYCHDVLEDTQVRQDGLLSIAARVLDDPVLAQQAVMLVQACSYSEQECALARADRKRAACARWSGTDDSRVHLVKLCDISDNRADAASVSSHFEQEYLAWALPLFERLAQKLDPSASQNLPTEQAGPKG